MGYKDKEKQKEYQKLWYEKKKLEKGFIEKSRLRCRKYKAENKEKINAQRQIYRRDNKEKIIESQQKYLAKKRKTDVGFLIKENLSRRLRHFINGSNKSKTTKELIGCTQEELIKHLESMFKQGMSWENYGKWHIDHIKPCSLFNLELEEEQLECFNYKNLQPLWAIDNIKKGNKYYD